MAATVPIRRSNLLATRVAPSPRAARDTGVCRAVDALLLEDRILLSAAPIDPAVVALLPLEGDLMDLSQADANTADGHLSADAYVEIAFVDSAAGDVDLFLADLQKQIEAGRNIEVVLLDATRDGVQQMMEVLAARSVEGAPQLDAIHIIAHGNARGVRLGSGWLQVDTFPSRLEDFARWDAALTDGGDVLFYSCDLAATEEGQSMLQALGAALGGDVAASTNDTGAAKLGGDWILEYSTGTIDASVAISAEAQQEFGGLLATFTVTTTANSGAGSLRQAILDANANPGADVIDFNIPLNDSGHYYYRDDGIAGSLSLVAATTLGDGAIVDFDPDYPAAPYSWYSISLTSGLPALSGPVTIDGTTQPGFSLYPIIELDGNGLAAHGLEIQAGGTTIQGLVINQFNRSGIHISSGNGNVIQGNFIGTDVSGTIDRGNGIDGIDVLTDNNVIGGTSPLQRNIISGNEDDGIDLDSAQGNVVLGNYIGVDFTGVRLLGNSSEGVLIENGSSNNTIGGTAAGQANVIAGNTGDGVSVVGTSAGNAIRGNSIHSNMDLGIDLASNGVTANDPNDADGGDNNRQNFPVITSAVSSGATTTISGTLHSTANATFILDLYASAAADGSGYGEGQTYLGSGTVVTDGAGNGSFTVVLSMGVSSGWVVSATATDAAGNTSEFAATLIATVNNAPVLDNTGSMTLTNINEDDTSSAGDTVAAIIASAGGDRITDLDGGAVEGMAVIGADNSNGQWQYNTGAGWIAFGAVANNTAVLLDTSAQIRFVPNPDYNGSAGNLTFRAWDRTDGNASGATGVDVSTNGGSTAYSAATETATLNVSPVNDAPVHSVPAGQTTNEDTPLTFSTANGNAISVADVDAGGNPIQVSLSTTNGVLTLAQTTGLTFSTGDGTADASMTFTGSLGDINSALDGLVYAPLLDYSGPDVLTIVSNDQGHSGGPPQADADAVAINVTFVGSPPVARSDSVQLFAAPSLTVPAPGVLANDSDVDGQPLTASLVSAPPNGAVTLNADGSFTYVPNAGFFGYDTFNYVAHDGILASAPATVTVLVVPGIGLPPGGGSEDGDDNRDDFAGTNPDAGQPGSGDSDDQDDEESNNDDYVGGSPDGAAPAARRFVRHVAGDAEAAAGDESPPNLTAFDLLLASAQMDGSILAGIRGGAASPSSGVSRLSSFEVQGPLAALSDALDFDAGVLFERLDRFEDAINAHRDTLEWIIGSAATATTVLTTGYVFWLVRGGYLFAGLFASMPAWYRFDPLPVLQSGQAALAPRARKSEDDSLEDLVGRERPSARRKRAVEPAAPKETAEARAT